MVELNRRTFLSGSVAAGAVALFGTEAAHAAGAVKLPAKWDETADVVIVGSGFAGLAAAIEAKKAGASVVVLEKMATVGGNSIINGGILTATGCPQQKKHGIKDSPELLAHDMLVDPLYLCCNWSETVDSIFYCTHTGILRSHGLYSCCCSNSIRTCTIAVYRAICGLCDR